MPSLNQFTQAPDPRTVAAVFLAHCAHAPERRCVVYQDQVLTYAGLRDQALRIAGALQQAGVVHGDRVALFLANTSGYLAAYLGAQLAGAAVVPVNTQYRQVELAHILADAGVCVCIVDTDNRGELEGVHGDLPELRRVLDINVALQAEPITSITPVSPDDLALIGYTSGTTGRSKGAMLLHRNLYANIASVCEAWRWTAEDHLLLTLPLFHVHGLLVGFHGTIFCGASCELHRSFDAATVFDRLRSGAFSMYFGVPTMYVRLLSESSRRVQSIPKLRLYVSGSAALSADTFDAFERASGQRILERYGMTETVMNTTNPYAGERRAGTVGLAFPGQQARIVESQLRGVLGPDQDGEIEVRGPHVFAGYWRNPAATAEAIDADGWFRTGDLGRVSADGYVTINGRAKELIISGGFNIYPREVEDVIARFPGVREVAVVGLPDAEFGESVAAAIVADTPALDLTELQAFCKTQLASYKKPRYLRLVATLPRNAMQKVVKARVRELFE